VTQFSQSVESRLVDVGYGKPMELSSAWNSGENTRQLLPACFGFQSDYAFHTDYQEKPFVLVDLLAARPVKRITVYNRDAVPDRVIPFTVSASLDKVTWTELARIGYAFGGRASDEPLVLTFRDQIKTRYLKFGVDTTTIFHLEYIEISSLLPNLHDGRLQTIDASGKLLLAEYAHHSSYGFTWTFTVTIMAIANCRRWDVTVSRVDYSNCLAPFKQDPGVDLYPLLFEPLPIGERHERLPPVDFGHHAVYATSDLKTLHEYAALYFAPSSPVRAFARETVGRYRLRPEQALALVFRGTDKWSEVMPAPIERYIAFALAARRREPDLQIVIQTDQKQALDAVLAAIPDAIFFPELPVSTGATVIHRLPLEEEFNITKTSFAVRMMAVIHLLAGFKYVLSHTGNVGLWIACYRGHGDGFYQFDSDTKLRDPEGKVIEEESSAF
jgi:hypothetical protein